MRREIELFQEMGKSERIMPLLIAGEPDESFPPELRRRRVAVTKEDGGTELVWEEVEPVAADVRPRKDESKAKTERRALLRLAAALLGCRFDDLARRRRGAAQGGGPPAARRRRRAPDRRWYWRPLVVGREFARPHPILRELWRTLGRAVLRRRARRSGGKGA